MTLESVIKKARKAKEEPPYEPYLDAGFDSSFQALVQQLKDAKAVFALAEAEKKDLEKKVAVELEKRQRDRVLVGDIKVLAYGGHTSWIDQTLLLENGVTMTQIEASKKRKDYVTVQLYPNELGG